MGFQLTTIVRNLLIANILVALIGFLFITETTLIWFFGLYLPISKDFQAYQIISYFFVHSGLKHLLFNMLGLIVFGPLLETFWGPRRFLTFYMICGVGSGLFYGAIRYYQVQDVRSDAETFLAQPTPDNFVSFLNSHRPSDYRQNLEFINSFAESPTNDVYLNESRDFVKNVVRADIDTPLVGASGAIFGLLIAFGLLFPNTEMMLLFPPIPIKAKYIVGFYVASSLYDAFVNSPDDSTAHTAHIGGLVFGLIMVLIWKKDRRRFY